MFLYGHMLRQHDRLEWGDQMVEVFDIWESKMPHRMLDGSLVGARWIELWTVGDEQIARPVTIVYTTDFAGWTGIIRNFAVGMASTPYHGSDLKA